MEREQEREECYSFVLWSRGAEWTEKNVIRCRDDIHSFFIHASIPKNDRVYD